MEQSLSAAIRAILTLVPGACPRLPRHQGERKIACIDTRILRVPLGKERVYPSQCVFPERKSLLVRVGRALGAYDIGWYEEPVPPEDRRGYRHVRQSVAIPVAGGECEYTRYGFRGFPPEVASISPSPNPLRDRLLAEPIALIGGRVPVPQGPGLGIAVHETVLREYERGGSARGTVA